MLLTKLHVPTPGLYLVHRTDLIERLNQGLKKKLILISAPAGFGKTTLLSDWIASTQIPTAWVSLDKRDNDPTEFLRYMLAGLQTIDPEIGKHSFTLLQTPQQPGTESIVSLALNDVQNSENSFLLVFDDFHVIHASEVVEIMKFILDHLPANLHLAVSSRSDPPLPVSRLRSQNELVELRSSDLSFSANDTYIFLNKKLKLDLSIDNIELLKTKTEGWIAGLQLSALSMKGRNNLSEFIGTLAGDNRYIMDYLLEEVLNMQPEEIREFLIRTSILEQVSGDLADAVLSTSNSQSVLERLDKNNMFIIPLDAERKWYRYHHLFADLLKQRLHQGNKEIVRELHDRAGEWFAENDFTSMAIEHAIKAGNSDQAMDLLNEAAESLWKSGQHSTIMKFGEMLPTGCLGSSPNFCLYYAWILNSAGHLDKAEQVLKSAELLALKDLPKNQSLYGKISVAYTYLLSSSRNTERIFHYCEQAQKYLTDEDPFWYGWAWFSYGVVCVYTGKLKESREAFEKVFYYGKETANLYLMSSAITRLVYGQMRLGNYRYSFKKCKELLSFYEGSGYAELAKTDWANCGIFSIYGYIHYMWNKLDDALSLAELGYVLSKKGNDYISQVFSTLVYAWILFYRGEKVKTESLISTMDQSLHEKGIFKTLAFSLTGQIIKVYIKLSKLDRAYDLIQSLGLSKDKEINFLDEIVYISYVRYLIAVSEYQEAEILLHKLEGLGEPGERTENLIEIKVLGAILYSITGDEQQASEYLAKALMLAEKENLMMFFVEERDAIGDLLKELYPFPPGMQSRPTKRFIDSIVVAIEKKQKSRQDFYQDPLSNREIEVLRFMADELSNQEIAENLFVSINTVKSHVKNIHLKLEVNSRTKAVAKAREFGII